MKVVQILAEKGADLDRADTLGETPLWAAFQVHLIFFFLFFIWNQMSNSECVKFQNGHLDIVELLLAKGAKIDHANSKKQTPLWIASSVRILFFFSCAFN